MHFFDPVALAQIGSLKRKARTIVEGALSGLHRSRHQGASVEFAEHKDYAPGDEVRHIDWKAYAKLDRYFVKRFEEETETAVYLLLDRSGSMAYKGRGVSKIEYAAYLGAALAYLFIHQQDKVGLYAFGGQRPVTYLPPRGRTSHLHDVLAAIEAAVLEPAPGPTGLGPLLERVLESARRRSIVIVLSDLFDRDRARTASGLAALRRLHHDVCVFQVLDRDELQLPFDRLTLFESLEDDGRVLADPYQVRTAYLDALQTFLDATQRACWKADVDYQLCASDVPLEHALLDFLRPRAERAQRRGAA